MVDSVLAVDDDPAFLALAVQLLAGLAVGTVLTAGDAATALKVALAERPGAILVDVDLPDRGGFDLALELERLPWHPRVVLTSTDREAGRTADGSALPFIAKEDLGGCELRQILLGNEPVSPLAPGAAEGYVEGVAVSVRVVLGEDDILLREGIARLLDEAGFEVVAQAGDADDFLRKALAHRPDVAVADIQMPPRGSDDGLRAALQIRHRLPETGVLLLSQFYDDTYALDLIGDSAEGVGYLLKERVGEVDTFTDAVARVAAGGTALDPEVVGRMLGRRRPAGPLDELTPRERDVLAQLAEGKSNHGIAEALAISHASVEKHVTSIFQKLALKATSTGHRRVLAALTYLRESAH